MIERRIAIEDKENLRARLQEQLRAAIADRNAWWGFYWEVKVPATNSEIVIHRDGSEAGRAITLLERATQQKSWPAVIPLVRAALRALKGGDHAE